MKPETLGNPQPNGASFFVFDAHTAAENAVLRLGQSGFVRDQLSLVGKGYHSEAQSEGFCAEGERLRARGSGAAPWGGVWSLLAPAAVFVLPGLGLVGMTGPLVEIFVDALDDTAPGGGLSALAATLAQVGVPGAHISRCEAALKLNQYVLVVHGQPRRQPGPALQTARPLGRRWEQGTVTVAFGG